ncbi:MAG: hypothetical protein OEV84_01665 [Betaproteobacteria bacterium]|nr:hypothetical protein [Betaproteobacteria bacterium]
MNDFWQHCLAFFEKELGQQQFVTWIQPLQCSIAASTVTITAPNRFVQRWVRIAFNPESSSSPANVSVKKPPSI